MSRTRAVFFDAVGTLIHPEPDAATVYAEVGRRFGTGLDAATSRLRFREAFARQDAIDREHDWRTDERRELERWRTIVGEVLPDVDDTEACFRELYEHFSRPANWRCDAELAAAALRLRRRGVVVGIASNFDERLRRVLAGWPRLAELPCVISAEVGWRKPSPRFFEAMARAAGLEINRIVYVGDDRVNDYDAARACGCTAYLVPRQAPGGAVESPGSFLERLLEDSP
jgi:putative hydrolase of the HAD superfamily